MLTILEAYNRLGAFALALSLISCTHIILPVFVSGELHSMPTLVVMTSKDIRVLTANATKRSGGIVVREVNDGAALALDYKRRNLFWTDHSTELLQTAAFDGLKLTAPAQNLTAVGQVTTDGLAIDWYTGNIYWTDGELDTVEVAASGGMHRRVLYWNDIDQPRAIALVPMKSLLFWTDWGEVPKIERASMNGDLSTRHIIVSDNIHWPNGLAVDYKSECIYWLDGKHNFIDVMDYNGENRKTLVQKNVGHPFALTFFDNRIYWTDWESWSVHTVNVTDGNSKSTILYHSDVGPMAIHVWDMHYQPPGSSPCQINNGGCSHLCLLAPNPPYYNCACPTGILLKDERTCRGSPQNLLLFAQRTHISKISVDTPDHTAFVIPLKNTKHTIALDFDPVDEYLYWTDDELRAIRRARLDGSGEEDLIVTDIDHPDGIALDWIARNLYWTDTGFDRIEVARYNGTSRKVVVNEALGEPRAIAVAPVHGWLFWTDWAENNPKIERSSLDGSERIVIVTTDLGWPNGLALDLETSKVYWGDAKSDKIEVANMDGTDRREVINENLPHLFGLSLLGDYLYWTDWQRRSIDRVNKITGKDRESISEPLPNIMGVKAVHLGRPNGTNACAKNNGNCSHLCLNRPKGYICACKIGHELEKDNRTCIVPEVFLLFVRKENIGRISIENGNFDIIPVTGVKSPRSLDFDFFDNRIYWTDSETHTISRSYLNGSDVQKMIELGSGTSKNMAIDWVAHNVYWTNIDTKRIEVARLDGSNRKILIWKDLDNPCAIVLDPKAAYIFWSELGEADCITRAAMDGSQRKVILTNAGNVTGMTLDYKETRIYWGDRKLNVIRSAFYDGSDVRTIISHDIRDPFSLTLYKDRIYWSDSTNKDVQSANKKDGTSRKKIASHPEPIEDFLVYHSSRQTGWNQCEVENGGCTYFCFALPDGRNGTSKKTCGCPTHYTSFKITDCVPPKSYMLFSHKNTVSRLLPGNKDCPDIVLPLQFKNIRAIEYDLESGYLYWIDGKYKTIRKSYTDGTHMSIVVQSNGHLFDLALDSLGRALYWSDSETDVINMTRLNNSSSIETVVKENKVKPRQIALHAIKRLLFWVDVSKSEIIRVRIDGSKRKVIRSGVSVTAMTIDIETDTIFYYAKSVFRCDLMGKSIVEFVFTKSSHIIAMAVFNNSLYWIDSEKQQIEYIDKNGKIQQPSSILPQKMYQLTDIIAVVPFSEQILNTHQCSVKKGHGKCSHLCVWSPDNKEEMCACLPPLFLHDNGQTCHAKHACGQEYFTCTSIEPAGKECIPVNWRCDGQKDCPDESDEQGCPNCGENEFKCQSGQCIDRKWVCDGTTHCADGHDEARCCISGKEFQCKTNGLCISLEHVCDGWDHCADSSDESAEICSNSELRKTDTSSKNISSVYIIGIIGLFGTLFLIILLVYHFRLRLAKPNSPPSYDQSMDPLSPAAYSLSKTDISSKKSRQVGNRIRMSTVSESLMSSYDGRHVTGTSSSTNGSGCYPRETLNPPPSPATTAASTRASSSLSRYRPYRHYRTINQPPPPTPCSTDVCDESDSNYHTRNRYDPLPPPYEPFPPPPTPRSHCHTESCPPSPSSRSSTNFSPLPPPPSPVP